MKSKILMLTIALLCTTVSAMGQFHTLKLPKSSNYVYEKQVLGVTDIAVEYHSPQVRERDVWNEVIPQNGDPIAWRVGANMNTTLSFSTDVQINGQDLAAGKYGLHVIPTGNEFEILFAHHHNQWGSYYLNEEEDITLRVKVNGETCAFSEKLDFEFIPKSDHEMIIGIEWAEKRIPFVVAVDLNETVVTSLRSELRGINTYHWQAWNDAANWCYQRNTNLEEALEWATRSIEGGYGGFAANKNINNSLTRARLEKKLGKEDAYLATVNELMEMEFSAYESNTMVKYFLDVEDDQLALQLAKRAEEKYKEVWFVKLNLGIAYYANKEQKKAEKHLTLAGEMAPETWVARVESLLAEVKAGTYQI